MHIDFITSAFVNNGDRDALVWRDQVFNYSSLHERVSRFTLELRERGILPGTVVLQEGDYTPNDVALFLALIDAQCIIVPACHVAQATRQEMIGVSQCEVILRVDERGAIEVERRTGSDHSLYRELRDRSVPGLVLFSSGSTGTSKAAVHDLSAILDKFGTKRQRLRTIPFLLFDHIGGINTMLYTLSNGGCLIVVEDRRPEKILAAIERHKVELLPTSPTFINLILLSEAYDSYDLSALQVVTYGTEPMPERTLIKFHQLFPKVRLQQTYGLSELGILRSKSERSDSLWVRLGGEGFETRVVDGILQIKAKSAMLGYLNAAAPFTADGWFDTGDKVEQRGQYFRILGRDSDLINVGGEKVYPGEIETVIQAFENVADVVVYGMHNAITGNVVCADVSQRKAELPREFVSRLKRHCRERLESYKVPAKVNVVSEVGCSDRLKKLRPKKSA
ncbi:MAG: AMP-binding protein [Planctomycetia bacterium]|nr:AMP-binding protein [Planctomycetia bacterium]